jgi:hypothetical protein
MSSSELSNNDDYKNNLIYNIITNTKPDILFNYFIIIIIFIFISNQINITQNVLLGILIACIIIHFLYTYRENFDISKLKERDEKYNLINTSKSILKNHTKFINIIFYISDIKNLNIRSFDILISQIESFCNTYESCITDFKLISSLYPMLIQLKINILLSINSLVYSINNWNYENKLYRVRNQLEEILNEYIGIILKNNKKNIYYNGYNINTKVIDNTNIIPVNSFYSHDFDLGTGKFSNLLFLT